MCVYGPVTFLGIRRSAVVVAAGLAAVVWTDWFLSKREYISNNAQDSRRPCCTGVLSAAGNAFVRVAGGDVRAAPTSAARARARRQVCRRQDQ